MKTTRKAPSVEKKSSEYSGGLLDVVDLASTAVETLESTEKLDSTAPEMRASSHRVEMCGKALIDAGMKALALAGQMRGYADGVRRFSASSEDE